MLYALCGAVLAALLGIVNSSLGRLVVLGSSALIIAFLAFPFSVAVGFLSRQTVNPTPAALLPVFPAFILVFLFALASFSTLRLNGRLNGVLALATGVVTLIVATFWASKDALLAQLLPLNGLMEGVTGLLVAGIIILLGWGQVRFRWVFIVVGILLGLGAFGWLNSAAGNRYFPNVKGYYKLISPAPEGTEERVIREYNEGLEALNEQRAGIGLNPLDPIEPGQSLASVRLPRAAADTGLRVVQAGQRNYGTPVMLLMAGLLIGAGTMRLWRPQQRAEDDLISGVLLALVVSVLAPAFSATDFNLERLVEGWPFLRDFLDRSWPPNPAALQQVASEMLITIEIALIGTFLAAIFAIPLSFLAARNLTQGNAFMRGVFVVTRAFFNVDRGVDTLILALIFVAAVGLGPFAGILAMAIHSIADLGKVYSESIENVDKGPIEALEAVGASGTNVVRWAIWPQVAPLFIAWTLYRFEINFRVSIVLGLVGAGGIGFFIQEKMATGTYNQMILAIIAIVIVVNIIDFASSWLRARLV